MGGGAGGAGGEERTVRVLVEDLVAPARAVHVAVAVVGGAKITLVHWRGQLPHPVYQRPLLIVVLLGQRRCQ